ncbi:hypothetical protein GTY75_05120 [Streptomyces sp. SID8381]|uniref:hypothetical protein n=1 Tax=unclassified Streptomyces TaxID=2593676 RepID=UPI001319DEEC|nr:MULTISPECIES: hypothetical protein [unclassified Streptomyces]MYX26054.1 hypothetical protein [Streptomyces sp. SID8381]
MLAATYDDAALWTESDYLLARISDALELSNFLFYSANSGEDSAEWPVPVPLQRPGEDPAPELEPVTQSHASTEEVISFFTRMNNLI